MREHIQSIGSITIDSRTFGAGKTTDALSNDLVEYYAKNHVLVKAMSIEFGLYHVFGRTFSRHNLICSEKCESCEVRCAFSEVEAEYLCKHAERIRRSLRRIGDLSLACRVCKDKKDCAFIRHFKKAKYAKKVGTVYQLFPSLRRLREDRECEIIIDDVSIEDFINKVSIKAEDIKKTLSYMRKSGFKTAEICEKAVNEFEQFVEIDEVDIVLDLLKKEADKLGRLIADAILHDEGVFGFEEEKLVNLPFYVLQCLKAGYIEKENGKFIFAYLEPLLIASKVKMLNAHPTLLDLLLASDVEEEKDEGKCLGEVIQVVDGSYPKATLRNKQSLGRVFRAVKAILTKEKAKKAVIFCPKDFQYSLINYLKENRVNTIDIETAEAGLLKHEFRDKFIELCENAVLVAHYFGRYSVGINFLADRDVLIAVGFPMPPAEAARRKVRVVSRLVDLPSDLLENNLDKLIMALQYENGIKELLNCLARIRPNRAHKGEKKIYVITNVNLSPYFRAKRIKLIDLIKSNKKDKNVLRKKIEEKLGTFELTHTSLSLREIAEEIADELGLSPNYVFSCAKELAIRRGFVVRVKKFGKGRPRLVISR
ncbi:hypothetical protein DRP04_08915 [Archaeoglobales archaeon]|nr:MAG: hypothetical protein DRP04_08915 [Archaeoglobales archaeon]